MGVTDQTVAVGDAEPDQGEATVVQLRERRQIPVFLIIHSVVVGPIIRLRGLETTTQVLQTAEIINGKVSLHPKTIAKQTVSTAEVPINQLLHPKSNVTDRIQSGLVEIVISQEMACRLLVGLLVGVNRITE